MSMPPVRYASSDGVEIAYQVLGEGPPDVVSVAGALTHLGVLWEHPGYRRFCEQLASFSRLILFDKRGMGLSERVRAGTLEERMEDVRAVMDAAGSEQAALIGVSEGGPMSMLFAATYPERTRALLLIGAEVKEEITDDWPWGETTREEFEDWMLQVPERWGKGLAAPVLLPEEPDQEAAKAWLGKLQTASATPGDAVAFMRVGPRDRRPRRRPVDSRPDADRTPGRRRRLSRGECPVSRGQHRRRPLRRAARCEPRAVVRRRGRRGA